MTTVVSIILFSLLRIVPLREAPQADIAVKHLSVEDGLSTSQINDFYSDESGLLWIATEFGLNRWDGVSVEQIDTPVNTILEICGDKDGHMWFRSLESLWELDLKTGSCRSLVSGNLVSMAWSGELYWATQDRVFARGNPDPVFSLDDSQGSSITSLGVSTEGPLYLTLDSGEVLRIVNWQEITHYPLEGACSVDPDSDGSVWINSRSHGTMCIRPDGSCLNYLPGASGNQDANNVRAVTRKSGHEFYVGTYDGLYSLDTETASCSRLNYQTSLAGFHNQAVRAMYADSGTLYIGTYHAGVHYWNQNNEVFSAAGDMGSGVGGLRSPVVSSIVEDNRGIIWIGSVSGGMSIIDPKGLLPSSFKEAVSRNTHFENVKSLYYDDREDAVWVGLFSEGIYCIYPSKRDIGKIRIPFYAENITRIAYLDEGHLLANCVDGLMIIDREKKEVVRMLKMPFHGAYATDFCVDSDQVWAVSRNAAYRFVSLDNMDSYIKYPVSDIEGMEKECLMTSIYKSKEGHLYFCSNGAGLFEFDKASNTIKKVEDSSGAGVEGAVNRLTEGPSQDILYMATNRGIAAFNQKTRNVSYFGQTEGFPLATVDYIFVSRDSLIYTCTVSGVKTAKEKEIRRRQIDYSLNIKDIYVGGEKLVPSPSGPLALAPPYLEELSVRGPVKSISLDVYNSRRDPYLMPAFEYCLEGFDASFQRARSRSITYTNIKPGRYRLVIRGLIQDATDSYPERSLFLRVKPPLYQAGWFIAFEIVFALLLLAVLAFVYARSTKLRMLLEVEQKDKERRQKVSEAKTAFITNVSHEFRTPLTLISSNLESLMDKGSLDKDARRMAANAFRNTGVLSSMVDEFIDYNRMSSDSFSLLLSPVEMNDLLSALYDLFGDYAKNRKISLVWTPSPERIVCDIDEVWFYRAIVNIVSNAFKYTKDYVEIKLENDGDNASITVRDNGVGIQKEHIEHIFERFYREKEANMVKKTPGSGIGLSFAKRIVEMHSGTIQVSSEEGSETIFTVKLPKSDKNPEEIHAPEAIALPEAAVEGRDDGGRFERNDSEGGKLLIVEDNPEMTDILCGIFREGFSIITADNGEAGLRMAERKQPDIIISDVMMPGMNGFQMCEALKTSPATSHIPIILLTALDSEQDIVKGLANGADDYLSKPFRSSVLKAKVDTILRNRRAIYKYFATSPVPQEAKMPGSSALDVKLLKSAVALVEENIMDQEFGIMEFAKGLGLSRSLLFIKIKSLTGLTPNEFVTSVKLRKAAAKILADPDETTARIAYGCGFNTPSYFIKCFKRFYGITPLQYRSQHRKDSANND